MDSLPESISILRKGMEFIEPRQAQKEPHPVLPVVGRRELITPNPKLKLLDQVREMMRLKHYSIRTEVACCDWIKRYVKFHRMRSREELMPGAPKVEPCLSDLAVNGPVAASTQNQAFNALLFLYREVLHQPLANIQAVRANRRNPPPCLPRGPRPVPGAGNPWFPWVPYPEYGGHPNRVPHERPRPRVLPMP